MIGKQTNNRLRKSVAKEDAFVKKKGFTAIELMIVVAIIGIIAMITVPAWVSMRDRERETSVKNNAHEAQMWVEHMADVTNGVYPSGIAVELNARTDLKNPFGGPAFVDVQHDARPGDQPGVCYFERSGDPLGGYRISANGKYGKPIITLTDVTF
jgi:prepilin-type N-terminal cleavage/methylation domain-containing protein